MLIKKIREFSGVQLALNKGVSLLTKIEKGVLSTSEEIDSLAREYSAITKSFQEAMNIEGANCDKLNKRYNEYFSEYLDRVSPHKRELDRINKARENLFKSTPDLREYVEWMNHLDSLEEGAPMKFEEYLFSSAGYLRKELPQVNYNDIDWILSKLNDENIVVNKISTPISQLKPTQKNFKKKKILSILREGMNDENFIPLVSKDLFILDGHHRWASLLEEDSDQIIDVYLINMDVHELVQELNSSLALEEAALVILSQGRNQGMISDEKFEEILCQVANIHRSN